MAGAALLWYGSDGDENRHSQGLETAQPASDTAKPAGPAAVVAAKPAAAQRDDTPETPDALKDWDPGSFAPSLSGTEVDGKLLVDANGNLQMSIDVKDFFDYFFSAVGERSPEEVIAEIERQVFLRLPPEAARQALQLMHDYIAYQEQMSTLMQAPLVPPEQQDFAYYADTMAQTFEQLRMLRRQHFSPATVDAFFGLDEAYGEYAVKTLLIQADDSLSDDQKVEQIAALESLLPEQMIAAEREAQRTAMVAGEAQSMYQQGASREELQSHLSGEYSSEEVDRLYDYYERESSWNSRMEAYASARSHILQAGLSGPELESALQGLRAQHFKDDELKRVLAEEAILDIESET